MTDAPSDTSEELEDAVSKTTSDGVILSEPADNSEFNVSKSTCILNSSLSSCTTGDLSPMPFQGAVAGNVTVTAAGAPGTVNKVEAVFSAGVNDWYASTSLFSNDKIV